MGQKLPRAFVDTVRAAGVRSRTHPFRFPFGWDADGSQVSRTAGSGAGAVTAAFVYDVRDKLVEVQQGAAILGRFQYDFGGRRNLKIGEAGLRQYVYDDTSLFAEYDSLGLQVAKYDYGSDRLIALTHQTEGRRYFSLDGLRSVVNLTDDGGAVVANYHLDAWGNFRFPAEIAVSRNRFGFTGHYFDTETGLYNAKTCYLDPRLGRFLTQDSFLGQTDNPPSLHRYSYGFARPTFYWDPDGRTPIEIGHVYIARGFDPITGEAVTYTGSTLQKLKVRFGRHKWKKFLNAETTSIEVEQTLAEADVEASRRGAKNEAIRSHEEGTMRRVSKEDARSLNERRAASKEHESVWRERHKVQRGKRSLYKEATAPPQNAPKASTVTESGSAKAVTEGASEAAATSASTPGKRGGLGAKLKGGGTAGVFAAFVLFDAYAMSREEALAGYVMTPYLLEDEGGVFVIESGGTLFSKVYQKRYLEGTAVSVEKKEFYELQDEAHALWGYVDWKGDWVPGKLRKELPMIDSNMGI